jgi:RNA polymerase sigma factor (sigma-70 family)
MADHRLTRMLQTICRALPDPGLPDGQLLARFVSLHDEAAFAVLMRRHGSMVYGVCRRILGHAHDAEDAYQAVFIVLVRRARSVLSCTSVGGWLHGVAYRTALQARAVIARRKVRERQLDAALHPTVGPEEPQDWRPLLDRELTRLPEGLRAAVVLCDLEGLPRKEAARRLGIPEGTLSSRLAAARRTLAARLARCGLAPAVAALAVGASAEAARTVPGVLASSTLRTAASAAAGQLSAANAAALLAKGMVRTMWITKVKAAAVALVLAATVGTGGLLYHGTAGPVAQAADGSAPPSEAETLRKQNELLKLNLQVVLEKLREQEAVKRTDVDAEAARGPEGEEALKRMAGIAAKFKYKVPFETGAAEAKEGAAIEILEVWGTQPKIVIGGQYLVRGKYTLPSDDGKVYFHETATVGSGISPEMDLQYTPVHKGQGEFTLLHGMVCPGFLHLTLSSDKEWALADVYFGTGDNVYRKTP